MTGTDGQAPIVSVVLAVHNGGDLVEAAVRSVLDQTITDLELVVCDDGSTDATPLTLERLAHADPRVVLTRRPMPSGGPAVPRNAALALARGRFVGMIDHDDVWMPDKLERQLPLLRAGAAVVYSDCRRTSGGSYFATRGHRSPEGDVVDELFAGNFVPFSTAMVGRSWLDDAGGFREDVPGVEDFDLWLRIALVGGRFACVASELVRYRDEGDSVSRSFPLMMIESEIVVLEDALRHRPHPGAAHRVAVLRRQAAMRRMQAVRSAPSLASRAAQLRRALAHDPLVAVRYAGVRWFRRRP